MELSPPIPQAHILVVEDEAPTREAIVRALSLMGYRADGVSSGEEALEKLQSDRCDLMLLDLRLPKLQGVEVMKRAVEMQPDLLVIILTAHATLESAIAAVRVAAVDYLLKPCRIQEIEDAIARALQGRQARLRRQHLIRVIEEALEALKAEEKRSAVETTARSERFVRCGGLTLDRDKRLAVLAQPEEGDCINGELTANEAALLAYLMQHPGVVLTCSDLGRGALGYDVGETEAQSIVRPHISRLRRKIEQDPTRPRLIRTVRGRGYLFVPP
jgi:DNA-binding response OmpR family regulator